MLCDHGADVNVQTIECGDSALMSASAKGHPAVVQILVDFGVDINAQDKVISFISSQSFFFLAIFYLISL